MYTTPVFGGFRVQAGHGQRTATGEATEFSVWYSGRLAGELQAAIGYSTVNVSTPTVGAVSGVPDKETMGGSISWLHTSGFNLTLSYTTVDGINGAAGVASREGKFWWTKAGYKFGQHAIALDYGTSTDMLAAGDDAPTYGIGYVWNPIRWAEFYAQYRIFQLERSPTAAGVAVSPEDVNVASVGTRIRF